MNSLLPLAVAVPLVGAAVSAIAHRRLAWQRVIGLGTVSAVLSFAVVLLVSVDHEGPITANLGGWPTPVGITLLVDRFAAMVLSVSAVVVLAVLVYSISQLGRDVLDWWFHPKYLVLLAGVSLTVTTSDLFTLFVGFEVTLIASYTLLTVRSGAKQVRSTMTYVVVNLVASVLFLATIAIAYSATGTLDMSDLAQRLQGLEPWVANLLSAMTLVVFGIKAALFPLYMWLPDSYPTAPSPVSALFAGLLTKIGVYAIFRTQTQLFDSASGLLFAIASATMFFGVLGAMAQRDVKRILSFHIVSQIGYMILGLGLVSTIGVGAGILYIVNQILVKSGLFLVAGEIEAENGGSELTAGGGLARRRPGLAIAFALLALSLAGVPPTAGFVLKFALVREAIVSGYGVVAGVALLVSFLTLFSMLKIWSEVFWGDPTGEGPGARRGMRVATAGLAALSVVAAIYITPLLDYGADAATNLANPSVAAQDGTEP